ncbi:MAG TPA: 2Fe-2S iron-sulfur cluster-binding protein [Myxococcota bacterium]|nr:2Fe-2S iron-sulfur cluster-binding protein [Myxococcota bacterium]
MEVTIRINDAEVKAQEGESLLDAARRAGFSIPSLCHHQALEPIGACRLCLVEVKASGKEELTTSCNFRVTAGIEVVTDSAQIRKQRAANLELLLARAPGSTRLRQLAAEYGVAAPRFQPRVDSQLPNCILCELCVRVCAELGHNALNTIGRGEHKRIGLPFNQPSDSCVGCGSCVSVCPTDCIFIKDTPTTRSIWGQSFPFVLCKNCGAPVITGVHRDFAIKEKGLPEDYYDTCESCKQAATSKRFAAVAW